VTSSPRRVIASGRDSDIVEWSDGLVLRRPKTPRRLDGEAAVMRHALDHGYPVPRVVEVTDEGLVMEHVDGVDLLDVLLKRPWRLGWAARLLADLHHRLHLIDAPAELLTAPTSGRFGRRSLGQGHALLHGDLHPGNVMLTERGPVVIDWANACAGSPGADVAVAWLIMAAAEPPTHGVERVVVERLRSVFVKRFLAAVGRDDARRHLHEALAARTDDPNLPASEKAAMAALVEREAT
jgi:aminoglycoside phosphotransferase (APT) family kinase protein